MPIRKSAAQAENDATEPGGGEGALGECDQDAGNAIEEDCAGRAEQPGQPRGEECRQRPRRRPTPPGPSRRWRHRPAVTSGPAERRGARGPARAGSRRLARRPGSGGRTRC